MSIKRQLARFEQTTCICVVFVCSMSPIIINYACPNFRTKCAMSLMSTLQYEFELLMLSSSIPFNGHVGVLC